MGKAHKVKKSVIISQCSEGGLGFIDLQSKVWALKAAWIPKIIKNESLNDIANLHLSNIGIDLLPMLRTNFKNTKTTPLIQNLPTFYQDVFIGFNKCKTLKPLSDLKPIEILSQVIWGNEYFKSKHKTLFFQNWARSGFIFVKDLLDEDGNWLSSENIIHRLSNSQNWIIELYTIKKTLNKILKRTETQACKYIQRPLLLNCSFFHRKKLIQPANMTSKDLYLILSSKKSTRSYTEKKWERLFDLELSSKEWQNIYTKNLYSLKYKKFCEFKYKILLDFLPCGSRLCKWNHTVSESCQLCHMREDICHMLYSCKTIKTIWITFSNCLNLNITMRHVILGVNSDDYVSFINNLCITIVSYSIFAVWSKSSFDKKIHTFFDIKLEIHRNLLFYRDVF